MTAREYYKTKFDFDIKKLPEDDVQIIATFYLADVYFTKEQLEEMMVRKL